LFIDSGYEGDIFHPNAPWACTNDPQKRAAAGPSGTHLNVTLEMPDKTLQLKRHRIGERLLSNAQ